jgi:hypothetical protein
MNRRLKELAVQAEILITEAGAFHNTPQGAYQLQEQHMKKFAELIVKECMTVARGADGMDATHEAWYLIKEHFGVEE